MPLMDPVKDLEINDPELDSLLEKRKVLEEEFRKSSVSNYTQEDIKKYQEMKKKKEEIKNLKMEIKTGNKMVLYSELKAMQRVLRRLEFCDKNSVQTKGKVACEISAGDELLSTEMLFSGMLNNLKPAILAAVLSAITYSEGKKDAKLPKNNELVEAFNQMKTNAERIGKIRGEIDQNVKVDEYVNKFKPDMMEITFEWCNGASFSDICKMTEIYEGTIIRCFRRLDELIKELINAAKVIGNKQIVQRLEEINKSMRRDIVFAASLYL
jgi:ATP-dependent RNA helicase DOB1